MSAVEDNKGGWRLLQRSGGTLLICSLLLMLSVAGCGGGGSEGGSDAITTGNAPDAAFTVSTDIGSYPLQVEFDASGTIDADGGTIQYDWDFGDGATGSGVSAIHTYETPGTYTAQLVATDESSLTGAVTHVIEVLDLYTISGTVTPAEYVVSDSDVNDPKQKSLSNDDFDSAQKISAPSSVSGYVNMAGSGAEGTSYDEGDLYDFYKVTLSTGMHVTLYMGEDSNSPELLLSIYDADQNPAGETSATVATPSASLTGLDEGEYYVRVAVVKAASAYALTIGISEVTGAASSLQLSSEFVPGEVLVRFEADAEDAMGNLAGSGGHVSPMGFYTRADDKGRDRLLRRSERVEKRSFFTRLGVQAGLDRSLAHGSIDAKTRAKLETLWMVRGLRKQPGVLYAEPNYIRKPMAEPNDTLYARQWHYPLINLPDAWDIINDASDLSEVTVAVIDSGVLLDHPDLEGQLVDGYDFISDDDVSVDDEPGIDDNPDDPGDQEGISGSSFHGTHVAGTIAARTGNNKGVAGVAWNAKVMPLRVLGVGGGYDSDIADAIRYAAGLDVDGVTSLDQPVDVINMSLGSSSSSQVMETACEEARAQGVIIIASAGNGGSSIPSYPAAFDSVVSVSAVAIDDSLAAYSNYGGTIDVAAPGGDSEEDLDGDGNPDMVLSTWGDDSSGSIEMVYAYFKGTSMAAPHVAGVAALMRSLYPGLTPNEFDSLLQGGYLTRDIGDEGRDDYFGWGVIDAFKAVSVVQDGGINVNLPPILSVSPSVLNFGATLSTAEITVKNSGGDTTLTLDGDSPAWSAAWLNVTASVDVDAGGLGTYVVEVNRKEVADFGTYYDTITFTASDGAQKEVAVSMRVPSGEESTDAGFYYILLLDPDTYDTIAQVATPGLGGVYEYSFPDLSYGDSYVIYAGTDPDNDWGICGAGEACGAYMSLDSPVTLTVAGDLSGLDFTTDVVFNLSSISVFQNSGSSFSLQRAVSEQDGK